MPPESAPPPPYSEQAPPQADGALGAGTSAIEESGVISEDDVLSTIEAGRASALGASLRHVAAQLQQLGDILNEVSLPTRPVAAAAVSDAHTQLKAGLAAIRRAKTAGEGSLADLGVPRNSHLETESDLVVRAAADETVADPDWASRALSHANIGLRRDFAASEATTLVIARTQRRPAMQHGIAVLGGHMLATARQSSTAANQIALFAPSGTILQTISLVSDGNQCVDLGYGKISDPTRGTSLASLSWYSPRSSEDLTLVADFANWAGDAVTSSSTSSTPPATQQKTSSHSTRLPFSFHRRTASSATTTNNPSATQSALPPTSASQSTATPDPSTKPSSKRNKSSTPSYLRLHGPSTAPWTLSASCAPEAGRFERPCSVDAAFRVHVAPGMDLLLAGAVALAAAYVRDGVLRQGPNSREGLEADLDRREGRHESAASARRESMAAARQRVQGHAGSGDSVRVGNTADRDAVAACADAAMRDEAAAEQIYRGGLTGRGEGDVPASSFGF